MLANTSITSFNYYFSFMEKHFRSILLATFRYIVQHY